MTKSEIGFIVLALIVLTVVNLFHAGQTNQKIEKADLVDAVKIIVFMIGIIVVGKLIWWLID